jgi:undecaprenyl-diphosphatase
MGLDIQLFRLFNDLAGHTPLLDRIMILLVNDYFVPTILSLVLFAYWFWGHFIQERTLHQQTVLYAVLALLLANALVKLSNLFYVRPRPFAAYEVNLLFYPPTDSSFPSNPTAVGFALAGIVWLRQRRLGTLMAFLALCFGVSRVYTGVHYPTDVLAGGMIGVLASYVVHRAQPLLAPLTRSLIALARKWLLA